MRSSANWRLFFLVIISTLVSLIPFVSACTPLEKDTQYQLQQRAKPYSFNFVSWEVYAFTYLSKEIFCSSGEVDQESRFRSQIKNVLADEDIPVFPPLVFRLEKPPYLLVVSPRDRIEYSYRQVLRQGLDLEEMERLETEIDKLSVSSLVVELGGFGGTYPAIIGDQLKLTDIINTAMEEWLHQYLALRPLGFLYLLDSIGIRRDPDVVTMNETLVGLVSEEITSAVTERYYNGEKEAEVVRNSQRFDFDAEMRETRKRVDEYLSQGKVSEAELYMEERRKEFVANGYYIRKLNQAYFAFHGIYAQDPASVSPAYTDLKQLRNKSPSLKYFLDKVAAMKSYSQLTEALRE